MTRQPLCLILVVHPAGVNSSHELTHLASVSDRSVVLQLTAGPEVKLDGIHNAPLVSLSSLGSVSVASKVIKFQIDLLELPLPLPKLPFIRLLSKYYCLNRSYHPADCTYLDP